MAQYIEIENTWFGAKYCCPACGAEVFTDSGEPTTSPCEHLLFSWIDAVGEYYNTAPDVQRVLQQYEEANEFDLCLCDEEMLAGFPENDVLFALTMHGMACGPVSTTIVHGIRFPMADEE